MITSSFILWGIGYVHAYEVLVIFFILATLEFTVYSIGSMIRLKCCLKYSVVWELHMEETVFSFLVYLNKFNITIVKHLFN